jgi:hypothetical protein
MNLFVRIVLWGLLLLMLEKADAQSRTGVSDEKVVVVTAH